MKTNAFTIQCELYDEKPEQLTLTAEHFSEGASEGWITFEPASCAYLIDGLEPGGPVTGRQHTATIERKLHSLQAVTLRSGCISLRYEIAGAMQGFIEFYSAADYCRFRALMLSMLERYNIPKLPE